MNTFKRPNYELVLRYLNQSPGERTVKLFSGYGYQLEYGIINGKLHHILYTETEDEMWCESDMQLNTFLILCEKLSEEQMISIMGTIALTEINRRDRENKIEEINT